MGNTAAFAPANDRRRRKAAATAVIAARNALRKLNSAPAVLVAAGELRLAHPDLSLEELGQRANPPVSKDTIAGRLRRLIQLASR